MKKMNLKSHPVQKIICWFAIILIFPYTLFAQEYIVSKPMFNSLITNELAPIYAESTLLYISDAKNSVLINYFDQDKNYLFNWYQTKNIGENNWETPTSYKPTLQKLAHNGSFCITSDGKNLFFTQDKKTETKKDSKSYLGLFQSTNSGTPKPFQYNNGGNYNLAQPAISSDGKTLVFVSDMPNGMGKMDLYFSEFFNGQWSKPTNLGNAINTSGNEIFPFIDAFGNLYFASNGFPSSKGYDIYFAAKNETNWHNPIRLAEPINSNADEYSFFITKEEDYGFFASNRDNSDDIFEFKSAFPRFTQMSLQKKDNFCFTLFENSSSAEEGKPQVYRWNFGDGSTADGLEVNHCFKEAGVYEVQLNVVDTLTKQELFSVASYPIELQKTVQVYISSPDNVKVDTPVSFSTEESYFGDIKPEEFYWNFNDGTKDKGRTTTHSFKKKGKYRIECGIVSIPDKKGTRQKLCNYKEIIVE